MQIKITVRDHCTSIRMTKKATKRLQSCSGELHHPYITGGAVTSTILMENSLTVSYKAKRVIVNDSYILEHLPQRNENLWLTK